MGEALLCLVAAFVGGFAGVAYAEAHFGRKAERRLTETEFYEPRHCG